MCKSDNRRSLTKKSQSKKDYPLQQTSFQTHFLCWIDSFCCFVTKIHSVDIPSDVIKRNQCEISQSNRKWVWIQLKWLLLCFMIDETHRTLRSKQSSRVNKSQHYLLRDSLVRSEFPFLFRDILVEYDHACCSDVNHHHVHAENHTKNLRDKRLFDSATTTH